MTWGGSRVGSGQKPKEREAKRLEGARDRSKRPGKSAKVTLIPPPSDLPEDQAAVWNDLAPHACEQRTLLPATVAAFRDLCEAIVLKRQMAAAITANGLTYLKVTIDGSGQEHTEQKANPLISQHRGMMQRVEAGMVRFRLAPIGKEFAPPKVDDEDPFDEFENQEPVN